MKLKTLYNSFCGFLCEKLFHFTKIKAKLKTKLKALCLLGFVLLSSLALFFGCNTTPVPQVQNTNTNKDTKETTKKERSTRSTTSARISCKDEGSGDCGKACKKLCDSMYSRSADEKECQEYSESLVDDMDDLLDDLERGKNTDSLDITALQCIFNIDDKPVIDAIEDMSSGSAKQFLEDIAKDEELAETLSDEDEDLDILKAIFKEVAGGSTSLKRHLEITIDDGKSFLWLVAEESNEPAWDWLEDYVGEECDDEDSDCPGGENIGAYCNALLTESETALGNFLDDADLFSDEYENEVTSDEYAYEVSDSVNRNKYPGGDFRDWCQVQKQGRKCAPDGTTPAVSKLARITVGNASNDYKISGGYCAWRVSNARDGEGTSVPSQTTIIAMNSFLQVDRNSRAELYLDNSKINYDETRTYYLYIGSKRYNLDEYKVPNYRESCGSTHRRELAFWQGFLPENQRLSTNSFDVWIASEKDGLCIYHK